MERGLFFDDAPDFLAAAFAGQCLFDAFFLAGLQIEGVFLDFLNDVFLLNFAFETPERIFDGFAFLNADFSQSIHPPSV